MDKLKPCPFCGEEIDTEKNVYISLRMRIKILPGHMGL